MKKARHMIFSKALALLLAIVTMAGIFTPMTTFASMEAEPIPTFTELLDTESLSAVPLETDELDEATEAAEASETKETKEPGDTGGSEDESAIDNEDTPTASDVETEPDISSELDGVNSVIPEETMGIVPLADWIENEIWFYTKIRLTVRDRSHHPIPGVVYGLFRADDGVFVEYLTTDSEGIAVSSDVRSDTDYYLEEYSVPPGWVRNYTRMYILLTYECDPTRLDLTVEYHPIEGTIKIIKKGENGEPLYGVGFHVYDVNTGDYVGIIFTDSNGEGEIVLPYGYYVLYEFGPLEGYVVDQDYYASITYDNEVNTLNIKNYFARGTCHIRKTGNDGKPIEGAVFALYSWTHVWIKDVVTGFGGNAYIEDLVAGDYYLIEKRVPAPYVADTTTTHGFRISYNQQWFDINIVNPVSGKSGFLTIYKTDEKGNPLPGVVFGVYRAWDDKKLYEITTGAGGSVTTPQALVPGDYYVKELVGKDGYEWFNGPIPFTMDGSITSHSITVTNTKIPVYGKVQINKTDDAGTPLSGVRFGLYCQYGNLIEELVTVNGIATSSILSEGEYYFKELSGIPGHLPNHWTYHVYITSEHPYVTVDVENPRIRGFVKVIKTGVDEETFLPGVVFGVYESGTDTLVCELTTTEDGTIISSPLDYGDYELRELSTVEGYELISSSIPFSIAEQDVIVTLHITNPLISGSVKIIKTDSEANADGEKERLSGAVFGIYNDQEQKLAELTTDENGEAFYGGLLKGDYFLKELSAPDGYITDDTLIPFSIMEQGTTLEMEISNTKGSGTLRLMKDGEDNVRLPDVIFEVYQESTNEKVAEIITDENGEAEITLPLGGYYLKETQTATGYVLPEGTISFELAEKDTIITMEVTNRLGNGMLHLLKTDEEGEALYGALFDLYQEDDVFVTELSTAPDGTAVTELPVGSYYLVEKAAPENFILDSEPHAFTIIHGEESQVTVVNKAMVGTVEVYFRHWDDGREIVHMQSLTDKIGTDYVEWMRINGYLDLLLEGYELVQTDFPDSLTIIDGTLVVTLWYLEPEPVDGGTIPKTGDTPPYLNYALALMLWSVAGYCGYILFQERTFGVEGKR